LLCVSAIDYDIFLEEDCAINTKKKSEFKDGLLEHLVILNQIISRRYGQPDKIFRCIGNLCYEHNTSYSVKAPPIELYEEKREFFVRALAGRKNLLEVGFNAGHSALLAMTSHPNLKYTGIDICGAKYTMQCANYLTEAFKDRFSFIKGDSREILPLLATHHPRKKFDVFHIDGDHNEGPVRADIGNILRIAQTGSIVILDDINFPGVAKAYDEFVKLGRLRPAQIRGFKNVGRKSVIAIPLPDSAVSIAERISKKNPRSEG